jgi:glutathione S-transferase
MLQIYGNPRSRAMRCLWMLEEMGANYRLIEKSTHSEDLQTAEYLRLNPNARIPTLVDRNVVIWESMAINLYLAQKYEGPMHCISPEALGHAAQWSFWTALEMENLLLELLQHRALLIEFARDPSYAERDELLLKRPLRVLNGSFTWAQISDWRELYRRRSQCGERFSVGQSRTARSVRTPRSVSLAGRLLIAACLSAPARSDEAQIIVARSSIVSSSRLSLLAWYPCRAGLPHLPNLVWKSEPPGLGCPK